MTPPPFASRRSTFSLQEALVEENEALAAQYNANGKAVEELKKKVRLSASLSSSPTPVCASLLFGCLQRLSAPRCCSGAPNHSATWRRR